MDLKKKIREKIGVQPAFDEAEHTRLPGGRNGPADAYRHVIGAAELTRRHGETAARAMLKTNEVWGDMLGQSKDERKMDDHNNEVGIPIGKKSGTLDEIVQRAREKIDEGVAKNGDGGDGTPKWLDQSRWKNNPEFPNWPPDWRGVKPSTGDYEYGGEQHRYRPRSDAEPLDRPVDTWSEDDVREVMASDAYQRRGLPGHQAAQDKVRGWFEHFYGKGPARRDAVGRMIDPTPIRPIPAGTGPVHVRAHSRDGGRVAVDAHDRERPSR